MAASRPRRIQALQQKRAAELNDKNKQLSTAQQKLEKEGSVMSASAAADLQKQIEKITVEVQRFTQDAQAEVQELQQQLQQEFQERLEPVLAAGRGRRWACSSCSTGLTRAWCGRMPPSTSRPTSSGSSIRPSRRRLPSRLRRNRRASERGIFELARRSAGREGGRSRSSLSIRYPVLLVDTIAEHEPGRRLVAIKNVTVNEEFFQGHFPGTPLMPAVLMIESLTQVATSAAPSTDGPGRSLRGVDNAKFRKQVVPGDRLQLR